MCAHHYLLESDLNTDDEGQQNDSVHKDTSCQARSPEFEPMWWKERTDYYSLSSDIQRHWSGEGRDSKGRETEEIASMQILNFQHLNVVLDKTAST